MAKFLLRALPLEEQFDVVIAMPMHWRKQWERGFNQAELLARPIAERFGLKLSSNLRRTRYTKAQAGLSEAERRDNLKDSFVVKQAGHIAKKRILLVDDVFTTGATLRAAARALKAVGAGRVTALTLARVQGPTHVSKPSTVPRPPLHKDGSAEQERDIPQPRYEESL